MGLFGTKGRTRNTASHRAAFSPVEGEQLFVGESFYQESLVALLVGRGHSAEGFVGSRRPLREPFTARLTPELNNEYDANAVAVFVDGHQVGHLSRANAAAYRRSFGRSVAEVPVEIYVKAGGNGLISIWPVN
ncbi:HIRAN domain-containing protein [Nocardioides ultimimeridianus]